MARRSASGAGGGAQSPQARVEAAVLALLDDVPPTDQMYSPEALSALTGACDARRHGALSPAAWAALVAALRPLQQPTTISNVATLQRGIRGCVALMTLSASSQPCQRQGAACPDVLRSLAALLDVGCHDGGRDTWRYGHVGATALVALFMSPSSDVNSPAAITDAAATTSALLAAAPAAPAALCRLLRALTAPSAPAHAHCVADSLDAITRPLELMFATEAPPFRAAAAAAREPGLPEALARLPELPFLADDDARIQVWSSAVNMAAFALDWAAGHASSSAEAAAAAARLKRAGDHLLRRRPPGLPADECAWAVRRLGLTTLPPREASPSSSAARPPPASGASASAQGAPAPQAAAAAAGGEHKTAACTSCGAARGAPGVTLRPCTGCRPLLHTYYCCAEHQRADWPRHKAECKAAQQQLKQQQGSGGGASNAHAAPAVSPGPAAPATLEGLLGLPVRELRALLAARGGSAEGVVEKADLAARVLAAVGQQRD